MVYLAGPLDTSNWVEDDTSTMTLPTGGEYVSKTFVIEGPPPEGYDYVYEFEYTWEDDRSWWEIAWENCPSFGRTAGRALSDGEVRAENSVAEWRRPRKPYEFKQLINGYFLDSNPCSEVPLDDWEPCELPGIDSIYTERSVAFGHNIRRI